ncbi:MAG: cation diffusion facilitator family transporter [Patescibacteria group bacterium]
MRGHLDACRSLETGVPADCRCEEEERRYMTLAGWSFGLFVFEFAGGFFANSLALMSDAFHVLFDGMENILSVFVARMSRESERNEERIRAIGGLVSASLLLVIAGIIIREGWERLFAPHEVAWFMTLVAVAGLGVNLWQRRHHQEAPDEHRNITHFWQDRHLVSDIAASGAVIIGGVVMLVSDWYWVDGLLSVAIGIWIAFLTMRRLIATTTNHHGHNHPH